MQLLPYDVFNRIMSYFPEKNKGRYGRVENYELSLKMCTISKRFRTWWCCSPNGPYKFSAKEIKELIDDAELGIRRFLGVLNQELVRRVDVSFQNVRSIEDMFKYRTIDKELLNQSMDKINPNAQNDCGKSALSQLAFSSLKDIEWRTHLEPLFDKASPDVIAEILPTLLPPEQRVEWGEFLSKMIEKSGGHANTHFQPYIGSLFYFCNTVEDVGVIDAWIQQKGMNYTPDNLVQFYTRPAIHFDLLIRIIEGNRVALDKPLKNGNHLIHRFATVYEIVGAILKMAPQEFFAKDKDGKTILSYNFWNRQEEMIEAMSPFLTEDLYWDRREECQEVVVHILKKKRLEEFCFFDVSLNEMILWHLKKIEKVFSSKEEFARWLTSPFGEGTFLHEIAKWSHDFFEDIELSQDKYELKNKKGRSVQDLVDLQKKLLMFNSGKEKDKEFFKVLVSESPDLLDPTFLFNFYRRVFLSGIQFNISIFNELLQLKGVDFKDSEGDTLLHKILSLDWETYRNTIRLIKQAVIYLMDNGFDPAIKNSCEQTVADVAIKNGWNELLYLLK